MQTWLDWYAIDTGKRTGNEADRWNGGAIRRTAEQAKDILDRLDARGFLEIGPGIRNLLMFHADLIDYVSPHEDCGPTPLAARLDSAAVRDLSGSDLTDEIRSFALDALEEVEQVYIDLPHRSLLLGDKEGLQLRAVFLNGQGSVPLIWAIFTPPGCNEFRFFGWYADADRQCLSDDPDPTMYAYLDHIGMELPQWKSIPLGEVARAADVDIPSVVEDIENLAWLAIAYLKTEQANRQAPFENLPRLPADDPRRSGRKARQVAKKFSLFSVVRISGTNLDREPATGSIKEPGRQLGRRRHEVRGHFRMQAYGPEWSKRRLRWIAPFKRGDRNCGKVTPLRILSAANDDGHPERVA